MRERARVSDHVDEHTPGASKYAKLPPPVELSETVASVDASLTEVEQGDRPDPNQGADPYLRIIGWKQP